MQILFKLVVIAIVVVQININLYDVLEGEYFRVPRPWLQYVFETQKNKNVENNINNGGLIITVSDNSLVVLQLKKLKLA